VSRTRDCDARAWLIAGCGWLAIMAGAAVSAAAVPPAATPPAAPLAATPPATPLAATPPAAPLAATPTPAPPAATPPAAPPAATPPEATGAPLPVQPPGTLREPAPRPVADLRVQNRFASNAGTVQVFGGGVYLERRDFYVSPGLGLGGTYYLDEALGLEVQIARFFSSLNQAGQEVQHTYGALPDSRAPTWLFMAGARYALGYGKMMIGGVDQVVHFQPQALVQLGAHVNDGSLGPSGRAGLGLLVHLTPRWFVRLDGALTIDLESRQTGSATVLGFLPSLVAGGRL
jgi:hypothetical protein